MSKNNSYDEIKDLLSSSRKLFLKEEEFETSQESETEVSNDQKNLSSKTYEIKGQKVQLYGETSNSIQITNQEKDAFIDSMKNFTNNVGEMADFKVLNIYTNNVEWSGRIPSMDIEFYFDINEEDGVYVKTDLIKLNDNLLEVFENLNKTYDQFKITWNEVLNNRKNIN